MGREKVFDVTLHQKTGNAKFSLVIDFEREKVFYIIPENQTFLMKIAEKTAIEENGTFLKFELLRKEIINKFILGGSRAILKEQYGEISEAIIDKFIAGLPKMY